MHIEVSRLHNCPDKNCTCINFLTRNNLRPTYRFSVYTNTVRPRNSAKLLLRRAIFL